MANGMGPLWDAASKLEGQVVRNPGLPAGYGETVAEAFALLRRLDAWLKGIGAPLRISGQTEDGRMWCLSNANGFVVAHVHQQTTAEDLVKLSSLGA